LLIEVEIRKEKLEKKIKKKETTEERKKSTHLVMMDANGYNRQTIEPKTTGFKC